MTIEAKLMMIMLVALLGVLGYSYVKLLTHTLQGAETISCDIRTDAMMPPLK